MHANVSNPDRCPPHAGRLPPVSEDTVGACKSHEHEMGNAVPVHAEASLWPHADAAVPSAHA